MSGDDIETLAARLYLADARVASGRDSWEMLADNRRAPYRVMAYAARDHLASPECRPAITPPRRDIGDQIRALVEEAKKTVSGRLVLADQIKDLLDLGPAFCDHEWSDRGMGDDRWRQCWLCGEREDIA